jgi:uncharacterized protein YlbG (UPF0298 family)
MPIVRQFQKTVFLIRLHLVDYNERDNFAELYIKMNACDEILGKLETLLSTFQENLSAITAHIQDMQQVSNEKDIKLNNRKVLTLSFSEFFHFLFRFFFQCISSDSHFYSWLGLVFVFFQCVLECRN